MYCAGSGTEEAQPMLKRFCQAAFADINMAKSWSVYY
jgi:hypothetical protein